MKQKVSAFIAVYFISCFVCNNKIAAQVKIVGAECIIPGVEYQYNFYGKWDKLTDLNICIDGGVFAADNKTCHQEKGINSIRVIWSENITKGKISITSSKDNGSLNVKPTKLLQGGKIDSSTKAQEVVINAAPRAVSCSAAKGGSCSPVFSYQWEQSDDNLHWTEIKDATLQNLALAASPDHTLFIRRRVSEISSNTIAYSDIAIIAVNQFSVAP